MCCNFLPLPMTSNFLLDARHRILPCWVLYIPINILKPCFGIWLSYLEIVWSFWFSLFKALLGMTQSTFSPRLIFPYYWGKTLLNTTQCPLNYEVFYSGWYKQASYPGLCEVQVLFSLIFSGSCFLLGSFPACMQWSPFNWILKRDPLQISRVLSVCISLLSTTLPWEV